MSPRHPANLDDPAPPARAVVASYNPDARAAGAAALDDGGNDFDAFVATTLVEYVVAPGVTSLAGPLTALAFHAATGERAYLDAELDHVADRAGMWAPGEPAGKGVMVPGALPGLAALHARHGALPWPRLVQPAIDLAERGFAIDDGYAAMIAYRAAALGSSQHGRRTFFRAGEPLPAGAVLRQPELADLLRRIAADGAAAMQTGAWAARCVAAVQERGGRMQASDLAGYRPRWLPPRHVRYRGFDVFGAAGRSYGGMWTLSALQALAHGEVAPGPHFTADPERLERMVRVALALWDEPALFDTAVLDSDERAAAQLSPAAGRAVWQRALGAAPTTAPDRRGSHSFHVVVVDRHGNAVTGTNTINSVPWADGVFVDGVPLTNFMAHEGNATRPGERRRTPMSSHLVFDGGRLFAAAGTFNSSLMEAGWQLLVNALDHRATALAAATLPRFGTFAFDDDDPGRARGALWLDPAVDAAVVDRLRRRGLAFEQQGGFVDTGSGAIVLRAADGTVTAGLLPLAGYDGLPTYRR